MEWFIGNFYKELTEHYLNVSEWKECPKCNCKPRVWIFDNGEFAKCRCCGLYDSAPAKGQTIWEYHKEHSGNMTNWSHNDLRDDWNKHCESL